MKGYRTDQVYSHWNSHPEMVFWKYRSMLTVFGRMPNGRCVLTVCNKKEIEKEYIYEGWHASSTTPYRR